MTVLLTEAGHHAMAAACLEQMRGLPSLSARDAASIAPRLQAAKAAASGRKTSADHYKMLGVPSTCSAEEVRREQRDTCSLISRNALRIWQWRAHIPPPPP